jgi:2-succinyl-5-enolpyruvyl-6-hydroxy-3-cyclohexene-1-carboxylate synthase
VSGAHLQQAWAEWLVDGLVAAGVRHFVVSPGSRSTPLILALARAETGGRAEVAVVSDERSAAFVALGQSRITGLPSTLVCTSGTAGAHWLPAIVEASEAGVPLLAITADRPFELQARGANQTTHQDGLFGTHVRRFLELGLPDADPRAAEALPRTAVLAVQTSLAPDPGPVHLNIRFRKPLEATGGEPDEVRVLRRRVAASIERGLPTPRPQRGAPDPRALDELAARVRRARRGVVVAGPSSPFDAVAPAAVERFLEASGFALLPEATSQLRFGGPPARFVCDAFETLFAGGTARHSLAPDFVLQLGAFPSGRALAAWLGSASAPERVVLARRGWPDACNQAADVLVADPAAALSGLADRLDGAASEADWTARAASASADVWRRLEATLAGRPGFSEAVAVRAAIASVPEGGLLALGNSLPVREVDLFCPASSRSLAVLSQRGVSGIDGLISSAAGAVRASGFPAVLLVGDVSFQHDVGGLAAARDLPASLAIVVLRNGGGRLFELLPVRRLPGVDEVFERYFLTPPAVAPAAAARAFGLPAHEAATAEELQDALRGALARAGATVVEARVDGAATGELVAALADDGGDDR